MHSDSLASSGFFAPPFRVSEVTRCAESLMPLSRCFLSLAPLIRLVKAEYQCGKKQKWKETLEKLSKHGLLFWHHMVNYGPKKRPKTDFFPDALFLHFPWSLPTFSVEGSYSKRCLRS